MTGMKPNPVPCLACRMLRPSPMAIDERLICDIHRQVARKAGGVRTGAYRKVDVWMLSRARALVRSTPPWEEVPERVSRLTEWLAGRQCGAVTAARAHLELVAIHPFRDGNGRTARALACLLLARGEVGWNGLCVERMLTDGNREAYDAAVEAAFGRDREQEYDGTPFVVYFLTRLSSAWGRNVGRSSYSRRTEESFVEKVKWTRKERRIYGEMVAQSWVDPAFKQQLLSDPAPLFRERSIDLPSGVELIIIEVSGDDSIPTLHVPKRAPGDPAILCFLLPPAPKDEGSEIQSFYRKESYFIWELPPLYLDDWSSC
jgi:hypothetical protein